ncbi:MAG: hypothetical protein GF346_07175, partial [Candidatus Eisenbacteria bacterium]|nr:hypothetical protein [Candidatus Latescibacterota bacterium]MBD3302212.1 hypothetical protein [Candidatus Eisenbacteria bacterium]
MTNLFLFRPFAAGAEPPPGRVDHPGGRSVDSAAMEERITRSSGVGFAEPPEGWLGRAQAVLALRDGGVSLAPFASLNLGRSAGDDPLAVDENERRLRAALRAPLPPARIRLEHGRRCVVVDRP